MKKLLYLFAFATSVATLSSCVSEVDDVFDKSSTERITESKAELYKTLQAAPNGWVMYLYGAPAYGGYNLLLKFNANQSVTAASEIGATPQTSHYRLDQSAGLLLSFDEYNSVIHYFSSPDKNVFGDNGTGFGGDLEFRVVKYSADRIELIGKKTRNRIVMLPLPAETTWEDYLKKVAAAESNTAFGSYMLKVGDKTAVVNKNYRVLTVNYTDADGRGVSTNMPYVVRPDGSFLLYDTLKVYGANCTVLTYQNDDAYTFTTDKEGTTFYGKTVPYVDFMGSPWFTGGAKGDQALKDLIAAANATLSANEAGETLGFIVFNYAANQLWIRSGTNAGGYNIKVNFTPVKLADNSIKMTLSGTQPDGNYGYYKKYIEVVNLINYFMDEWTIEYIGNPRSPEGFVFTTESGKTFRLGTDLIVP